MIRALLIVLFCSCASVPAPPPAPTQLPQLCGFTRKWLYCCIEQSGPDLIPRCKEFEDAPDPSTLPLPRGV